MDYLVKYRQRQDGRRHTISARDTHELIEILHEAIMLADDKSKIVVESDPSKKIKP